MDHLLGHRVIVRSPELTIADRRCRLERLQRRWDQLGAAIDAFTTLTKEAIPLLKEERDLASEAAAEMGQQVRKADLSELSDEQAIRLLELLLANGTL